MHDIYFLITWILIGVLICMVKRPDWFPLLFFRKNQRHEFPDKDDAQAMAARALKRLNVISQEFSQTETGWTCSYAYQTGHFIMTYSERDNSYVNIIFPGIGDFPTDHIDAVRMTVNRANSVDTAVRFFYVVDEDHNLLILHTSVQIANTRHLNEFVLNAASAMQDLFRLRNDFIESVNDAIKASDANGVNDVEYSHAVNQRISHLLLEQFIESNDLNYDSRRMEASKVPDTSVCEWLETMGFLKGVKLLELKVVAGDTIHRITQEDEILHYTLADVLKSTEPNCEGEQPIMQIRYTSLGHKDVADEDTAESSPATESENDLSPLNDVRSLTLTFTLIKRSEQADYYKMDYLVPVDDTLHNVPRSLSDAEVQPLSGSTFFAVNKMDEQKMSVEYNYVINDAMDKLEEGKTNEMNEEQRVLMNLFLPESNFFIYWGHRYMRAQCYLQAFLMFRRAWTIQNRRFRRLENAELKAFYDLNYWMGGCLYKLGLYKQAYYYLSMVDGQGVIDYAKMNVKCLHALKDPRTLSYVRRLIRDVKDNIDQLKQNEAEVPESLTLFLRYLNREEVLVLMDTEAYLAAEPLCHEMLKRNEDTAFAQEQLDLIAKKNRKLIDDLHVKKSDDGIPTEFTDNIPES